MNENKKTTNSNGDNKPWFKKKSTIIASSSILGVGALVTVITVPIVLTQSSSSVSVADIIATNKILNEVNNKDSRVGLWNKYMSTLAPPTTTPRAIALDSIVRTDAFINEFISFLTDNLYVTANGSEAGAITQVDVDKIKSTISNATNKPFFTQTDLTTYTELFTFSKSTAMFTFKDKTTGATIEFSLLMPLVGLDLIYNDDSTVSVKTSATHNATEGNNVRLTINTFTDPAITSATPKNVYFKAAADIKLPSAIMSEFPAFFSNEIKLEQTNRTHIQTTLGNIKTTIDSDTSKIKSMSYWNSFALLYDKANVAFLKADLLKTSDVGNMYKFLAANAKDSSSTAITTTDLDAIKTIATAVGTGTDTTQGAQLGLTTPFVTSPSYTNLLLNTTNTSGDKYTLELNVTKFSYEFKVDSFFSGFNTISITPSLELSGKLVKQPTDNGTATTYNIANATYDVSSLVSLSPDITLTNGGLVGYFSQLTELSTTTVNDVAALTNGLVALNSKTVDEQILFWNTFSSNTVSQTALLADLKATGILSGFISNYIDTTNLFGFTETGGSLPTIVADTLKSSIESAKSQLTVTNLNFTTDGTSKITLQPTNGIVYGTDTANDKFESITIYFGYEKNSLSDINVTSKLTGGSNVSFSQTIGASTDLTDDAKVIAAASKRVSIVFKKTTGGTAKTSTSVAYFGQSKNTTEPTTQTTKPIIISDRILRANTKFIEAIKAFK